MSQGGEIAEMVPGHRRPSSPSLDPEPYPILEDEDLLDE
jgi:hypothetical protein